jgi:hypothetical protein
MYAGYVGGNWPTYEAVKARFPDALVLSIAVNSSEDAMVLDVEKGDATPADVPAWVERQIARGSVPIIYCSSSVLPDVAMLRIPGIFWWVANYGGTVELGGNVIGHQYVDTGPYDMSVFVDYIPGIDPSPIPPPPARPTLTFPPLPVEGSDFMKIRFQTTTGSDGTAYVPINLPHGAELLGGWVDVLDPSASTPPAHDGDVHRGGVTAQPTVGGTASPRLRIVNGLPNHFYTGHAIVG